MTATDNSGVSQAAQLKIERERRKQYELGQDFSKWNRLMTEATALVSEADALGNKQVFDFVQRAMTAAVTLAGTYYVIFGPGFSTKPTDLVSQIAWGFAGVGLIVMSFRLTIATWTEASRFGALVATEIAIFLTLTYRPRLRRVLTSLIAAAVFAGIVALGSLIGKQALGENVVVNSGVEATALR